MSRRLRRAAARRRALFVVATESDKHSETNEAVHDETVETASHDETGEPAGGGETGEAAGHDEAAEGNEGEETERAEEGTVLGIDAESPGVVAAAVVASVALAVGLWLSNRRWLALLAAAFGVVFTVFNIAEIGHQLDESRTGLAAVAGVIAALHLAAAGTAAMAARPVRPS